jgi:hypothetical protein
MQFNDNHHAAAAAASRKLIEHGLPGRGVIVSTQRTNLSTGHGAEQAHVCVFTVRVRMPGGLPFTGTCRQAVRAAALARLMPGATVPVRVDRADRSLIALALDEERNPATQTTPSIRRSTQWS